MNIGRGLRKLLTPLIRRNPALGALYIHLRGVKSILAPPRMTPMGYKLVGNKDMLRGEYEPVETRLARCALKDAEVFINIGANSGYYCAEALSRGIPTIAFEPLPQNLAMLYSTIAANHWQEQIEIYPVALGKSTGLVDIYGFGTGASLLDDQQGSGQTFSILVPLNTADNLVGQRLTGKRVFILMDAEGAEHDILFAAKGLRNQKPKPVWQIEIFPHLREREADEAHLVFLSTFEMMWDSGYRAINLGNPSLELDRKTLAAFLRTGEGGLSPNYLFIDASMPADPFIAAIRG